MNKSDVEERGPGLVRTMSEASLAVAKLPKIERICKILTILVSLYGIAVLPFMREIWQHYEKIGYEFDPRYYLLIIPGFLLTRGLYVLSSRVIAPAVKPYMKDEQSRPEDRRSAQLPVESETIRKMGNYIYQSVYYTVSACGLLLICWRDGLIPAQLGGPADPDAFCRPWPQRFSTALKVYYILSLGHHFERVYYEFHDNALSLTFHTMLYHHTLTIMLIVCSFTSGLNHWGAFIILTHDFTDIILNSGRIAKVTLGTLTTNVFYIILLLSWISLRIVVYCRVVLYPVAMCVMEPESAFRQFTFANLLILPTLTTLFLLNLFWLYQILKIGFNRLFKRRYEVSYLDTRHKAR